MKAEHITLLGTSLVRDSKDILLTTITLLQDFQVKNKVVELNFPRTDFVVKITSADEGAIFDIKKEGQILFTNFCCFGIENKTLIYDHVAALASRIPFYKNTVFRVPDLSEFLYTVPISPFSASPDEIMTCGEIEFYIYYSLYLAQKK